MMLLLTTSLIEPLALLTGYTKANEACACSNCLFAKKNSNSREAISRACQHGRTFYCLDCNNSTTGNKMETPQDKDQIEQYDKTKDLSYEEIFISAHNKLTAEGFAVEQELSEDARIVKIDLLQQRVNKLERAMFELRHITQATIKLREDHKGKLSKEKQQVFAKQDMELRQKKQQDKLDSQARMRKAKAESLRRSMLACGQSEEEVNAILSKKGLI